MLKKALFLGFSGALLIGAFAAPATAADGFYVSGNVGASFMLDGDATEKVAGVTGAGQLNYENGFAISGAIGHAWGPFRLEGELSYRENGLDSVDVTSVAAGGQLATGLATFALEGDVTSFGFMANAFYDIDAGDGWAPFVMAGIGGAAVSLDVTSIAGVATTYDESETVVAYQVGAGLGYELAPGTMATLQYRFFGTADPTVSDGTFETEFENQNHNLLVGITQKF